MKRTFLLTAALLSAACRGDRDPVLARVGRLAITQSEFQRKLAEVSPASQDYVLTPGGRRQFLDVLIREKLVLVAAQHSDVAGSSDFRSKLEQLKRDEEDRVRDGSEALLTRMWVEDLRKHNELKVSDQEINDYLSKYPNEVLIRHVLLATAEKAQEVAKKIRSGANFEKVAQEQSLDGETASKGGAFPPLLYGEVIPEIEEAVFRMQAGEIGGPLKSKFGYHIVRKDGARRLPANEETRERVARLIEKQKFDHYLQQISDKYPVEVVDEQFK